ncbi:MAG: hypothetical protein IPQ18_14735 [Saprospiraceae bacterium]|nr:hypothetical protein [Saprospiraceae bacterium]
MKIFPVQKSTPMLSVGRFDASIYLIRMSGSETFGLTIIEGMAYSLPAIVPPSGDFEVIEDGVSGMQWIQERQYKSAKRSSASLKIKICIIKCPRLLTEARNFTEEKMLTQIRETRRAN